MPIAKPRRWFQFSLRTLLVLMTIICVWLGIQANREYWRRRLAAANQRLIVACYKLEVDQVVASLREGASVNAKYGQCDDDANPFHDAWSGGWPLGSASWTPLIAVASSCEYPDPPVGSGEIWHDRERARALQQQIPQDQIDRRRSDAMTILSILLSHGCNLDHDDGYGATALYMSIETEKVLMAKTLLQSGANPNTKTGIYIDGPGDVSPLHQACNSQELLQLLLEHGADASVKDGNGRTPADWVSWDHDRQFDLVSTTDGWRIRPREPASEKAAKAAVQNR